MSKGGKLSLWVHKSDGNIDITVQDTGQGIPENVKEHVFEPLFTTRAKGQGFGLAVTKKLVEQLGGTITFDSQEGKGTTFKVKLPNKQV